MKLSPRAKLLLLVSVFLLPIAASFTAYFFFPPSATANYGELLLPPKVLAAEFRRPYGERWLLITAKDNEPARQVRLALGRDASRVELVVAPAPELARAGAAIDEGHIYLADPHGNVMMRWPASPELKRMLGDLKRLLKASQIG
jgi:hypothetical protein